MKRNSIHSFATFIILFAFFTFSSCSEKKEDHNTEETQLEKPKPNAADSIKKSFGEGSIDFNQFEGKYTTITKEGKVIYYEFNLTGDTFSAQKCINFKEKEECPETEHFTVKKIEKDEKDDRLFYVHMNEISGEMVPTWTFEKRQNGTILLHVHDYNAETDTWYDTEYSN